VLYGEKPCPGWKKLNGHTGVATAQTRLRLLFQERSLERMWHGYSERGYLMAECKY